MTELEWLTSEGPERMLASHRPPDDVLRSWVQACRKAAGGVDGHHLNTVSQLDIAVIAWCYKKPVNNLAAATRSHLLREVAGNPFRPVALRPEWLTLQVIGLAEAALAEKKPGQELDPLDLLPVADALEEAGCTEEELLRHLRGQEWSERCLGQGEFLGQGIGWISSRGPHVTGCWALGMILGRGW